MKRSTTLIAILIVACTSPLFAEDWKWRARCTEGSSDELMAHHAAIYSSSALTNIRGVHVRDVTWHNVDFSLHMIDGTVFLEPDLNGEPAGAF